MALKPPPAFQMYAADWLSSTSISLMSASEERGYHRLLLHEWADDDCSLPDDRKLLKRLALTKRDAELDTVLRQFEPHPTFVGRIINRRLYEQRLELEAFRAERSHSGRKGADSKWGKEEGSADSLATTSANGSEDGSGMALHSSSSSFSISLPSEEKPPSSLDLARVWNENCGKLAKVRSKRLATDRNRKAMARLREEPDLARWAVAVKRLASGFAGDKPWADFDFMTSPGNLDRIEEGKYDQTWGRAKSAAEINPDVTVGKGSWDGGTLSPESAAKLRELYASRKERGLTREQVETEFHEWERANKREVSA